MARSIPAPSVPIAQLHPDLELANTSVTGIVTLVWPYTSFTKSTRVLLVEPDFRLRRQRGQVRIKFQGSSAKAVAKAGITSGDQLLLSLVGTQWARDESAAGTPGKGIEWELLYTERVQLEVLRTSHKPIILDVDYPPPLPELPVQSPTPQDSPTYNSHIPTSTRKRQLSFLDENQTWTSPAFLKRVRCLPSSYDPFAEEEFPDNDRRKKTKFGLSSSQWTFKDRAPSPEKESDATPVFSITPSRVTAYEHLADLEAEPTKAVSVEQQTIEQEYATGITPQVIEQAMPEQLEPSIGARTQTTDKEVESNTAPKDNEQFLFEYSSHSVHIAYQTKDQELKSEIVPEVNGRSLLEEPDYSASAASSIASSKSDSDEGPAEIVSEADTSDAAVYSGDPSDFGLDGSSFSRPFTASKEASATVVVDGESDAHRPVVEVVGRDRTNEKVVDEAPEKGKNVPTPPLPYINPPLSFKPQEAPLLEEKEGEETSRREKVDEDDDEVEGSEPQEDDDKRGLEVEESNEDEGEDKVAEGKTKEDVVMVDNRDEPQPGFKSSDGFLRNDTFTQLGLLSDNKDEKDTRPLESDVQIINLESSDENEEPEQFAYQASSAIDRAHMIDAVPKSEAEVPERKDISIIQQPFKLPSTIQDTFEGPESQLLTPSTTQRTSFQSQPSALSFKSMQEDETLLTPRLTQSTSAGIIPPESPPHNSQEPSEVEKTASVVPPVPLSLGSQDPATAEKPVSIVPPESSLLGSQESSTSTEPAGVVPSTSPGMQAEIQSVAMSNGNTPFKDPPALPTQDLPTTEAVEIPQTPAAPKESTLIQKLRAMRSFSNSMPWARRSSISNAASPWFAPRRSSQQLVPDSEAEASSLEDEPVSSQSNIKGQLPIKDLRTPEKPLAKSFIRSPPAQQNLSSPNSSPAYQPSSQTPLPGFRTNLSYFVPLASLPSHFGTKVDILAICVADTPITRAPSGVRDYTQTIYITDPPSQSLRLNFQVAIAQIFRPNQDCFPVLSTGDALLLRDFKVQSFQRRISLLSTDTSAWLVFRQDEVQQRGPPCQFGAEERGFARGLKEWWGSRTEEERRAVQNVVPRPKKEGKTSKQELKGLGLDLSCANSVPFTKAGMRERFLTLDGAVDRKAIKNHTTRSDISKTPTKRVLRPRKGRAPVSESPEKEDSDLGRAVTHELRDGTRYQDEDGDGEGSGVHELRDGRRYKDAR